MNSSQWTEFILFLVIVMLIAKPLGLYMAKVFDGEKFWATKFLGRAELLVYKILGLDPQEEMSWKTYLAAFIWLHLVGFTFLMILQMTQAWLPFNPQSLPNISWQSAFNTSISFVTNTNWQSYTPETTMSYLTQMLGLCVQNFSSAACGIAVVIMLTRGITQRTSSTLGNFWVDIVRATLYVLLPLSIVFSIFLISQGVVQSLSAYAQILSLEGIKQTIALGPAASQIAIKMLGTNGGGFFNANAAHPFENPTPISNFIQMISMFAIGAGLTYTYGYLTKAKKHGWIILTAMLTLFTAFTLVSVYSESTFGSLEGKETRFGIFESTLFSSITTSTSCGAVNAMHSSLSPLSQGVALINMMIGEVIIGGVGSGLYGMILFIILSVFIAGLMVGRTPEYMGKKIEAREIQMVILAIVAPCAVILIGTALSLVVPSALASMANKGPHGFTEILYAFTSTAANNGSSFAGLNANTNYFNIALGISMLLGRFLVILPVMAIAGILVKKKYAPPSAGTFETDTLFFAGLLIAVILIVGALTFLPALALGPLAEHFLMLKGQTF